MSVIPRSSAISLPILTPALLVLNALLAATSLGAAAQEPAERTTEDDGGERQDESSWLHRLQTPPDDPPDDAPRLSPIIDAPPDGQTVDLERWQERRAELRRWWLEFLKVPLAEPRSVPRVELLESEEIDEVIRERVSYETEPGWTTEAYLLRPRRQVGPLPGVVVFHSTVEHSIRQPAGVEGRPEKAFGLELAKRGYVTLCPRNFLWPTNTRIDADSQTQRFHRRHPDSKGMAKMLGDALVALDVLASRPEVDRERLGAVGHSLGAKEVLYLAALDERVKATVSSEGGIGTRFSNWDAPWYLGRAIREPEFDHEHHELLALAAPRPFLVIGGDSADGARSWPFIQAALPIYRLHGSPPWIGLLNHGQGHSVPPSAEDALYRWLDRALK